MKSLFDDAVSQVRNLVAFANLYLLEADVLATETVEETDPFAQENWHHVHPDFIHQASR
jgi:hypothetical protein